MIQCKKCGRAIDAEIEAASLLPSPAAYSVMSVRSPAFSAVQELRPQEVRDRGIKFQA